MIEMKQIPEITPLLGQDGYACSRPTCLFGSHGCGQYATRSHARGDIFHKREATYCTHEIEAGDREVGLLQYLDSTYGIS